MKGKHWALLLGGVGVFACLGCGLFAAFFAHTFDSLDQEWNEVSVFRAEVPNVFGVKLVDEPLVYRSHAEGFQDGLWNVVARLPDGSADHFLKSNHLTRSPAPFLDSRATEAVAQFAPDAGAFTVSELELPEAPASDGGSQIHRRGFLFERGDEAWLWLEAFETLPAVRGCGPSGRG